jgi:hypothetical protein
MRFRYIGDSDNMTVFGYSFAGGNEPEVNDVHAIGKLSGNQFFEAVGEATQFNAGDVVEVIEANHPLWDVGQVARLVSADADGWMAHFSSKRHGEGEWWVATAHIQKKVRKTPGRKPKAAQPTEA